MRASNAGCRRTGCALLAAHPWDTDGAKRAGLRSAWLNRRGGAYPPVFLPADVTGADLPTVAAGILEL